MNKRPSLALLAAESLAVGGQAVMEGIMMRNGDSYALALRLPDGSIQAERRPWRTISTAPLWKKPFLRGFPTMVETMLNGFQALNRSAECLDDAPAPSARQLVLTIILAFIFAIGLFVALPHFLSLGMQYLGMGSDLTGFTFHLWDGLFKFAIFLLYICLISLMPDIRRVFQYHGAEHKVIHAFEESKEVSIRTAARMSRLHPRCGTTFLLFVLCLAIIMHAILVPPFLWWLGPLSAFATHSLTLLFKVFLMIPISALAYEIIRHAARMNGFSGAMLRAPGLLLQLLSTREPDKAQLEVGLVALREALGDNTKSSTILTPAYTSLE